MTTTQSLPLIGIASDVREFGIHPFHAVGEKYINAVAHASGALPMLLPTLGGGGDLADLTGHVDLDDLISRLDGLFLPGSPSNVEPAHYQGSPSKPGTWHDPERDAVALPLILAAIRSGIPLFTVCRGFQEMNVALGGTLHQLIHEVPGYHTHKADSDKPIDVQYGPSHEITFTSGGLLATITGKQTVQVNSLHSQAVDQLADGLDVEATADDGLIEAFVVRDAPGFTLGVQWHPEWAVADNADSLAIFRAFGQACRAYRDREA